MRRFFLSVCAVGLGAVTAAAQQTVQSAAPGLTYQVQNYNTPAPLGGCDTSGAGGCTAAGCEGGNRLSGKFRSKPMVASCDGGGCATRGHSGRLLDWFCYKPNFVTNGPPCFQPTPYLPPLYNWFPCQDGCGRGCASGSCGTPTTLAVTGMAPAVETVPAAPTPMPKGDETKPRSKETRVTVPTPTAARPPAVPGLRFATAETPNAGSKPPVQPWPGTGGKPAGGVTPVSYSPPAAK